MRCSPCVLCLRGSYADCLDDHGFSRYDGGQIPQRFGQVSQPLRQSDLVSGKNNNRSFLSGVFRSTGLDGSLTSPMWYPCSVAVCGCGIITFI